MALGFRDGEALRVVLASGLCPGDVLGCGARVGQGADGSIVLEPDQRLPAVALHQLRAIGVAVDAERPPAARQVRCWAEAVPPLRVAVAAIPSLVLLVTERAAQLVDLAAELLRLGCDRQELRAAGGVAAIRAVDPPTYTVLRALDREAGLRAFAPDPPGQDAVWTELGYRHPLADRLRAEPATLLLIGSDRWRTLGDTGWLGLDAALELAVPGDAGAPPHDGAIARRTIELRLTSGHRQPPSLWVVRHGGMAVIDRLLAYLPEDIACRLAFAATGGDAPIVVVRARGGRHAPPELALAAEDYAPLADLPDVYAPAGTTIEPPLRPGRLRAILGATGSDVLWLAALPQGRFRVERIADDAFLPLAEWADYVLHASAPALVPWMRATELDFAPLVSTGVAGKSGPAAVEPAAEVRRDRPPRPRPLLREGIEASAPVAAPVAASVASPVASSAASPVASPVASSAASSVASPVAIEAPRAPQRVTDAPIIEVTIDPELAALERAFVELDAPGDAPGRIALLDRLATAYARLGRRRDAGLCVARAVWEAPAADAGARLHAWIAADGGLTGEQAVEAILAQTSPDPDDVRAIAVLAALGALGALAPLGARAGAGGAGDLGRAVARDPHRVQRWLDDHDAELDARALWLSRLGLAQLAGGDPLALAHARDRILARLAGGLPVEHELPAFLQLARRSGALGAASGEHLNRALEDLVRRVARTQRKRSLNEAPVELTGAYVDLILAHGFARIGRHVRARELTARARAALSPVAADPVHAYLLAAFSARVDQALSGSAPEAPLPGELGVRVAGVAGIAGIAGVAGVAGVAGLDRLARFKVDRLREASRILEPLLWPDAFGAYLERHGDARGPEFAALRGIADPQARADALGALVDVAAAGEQDRERLIDGILDALLELTESAALPILLRTHPLIAPLPEPRHAVLYARALVVAGHFGHGPLVSELLGLLGAAIRMAGAADLERALHHSLRALRRIGLRAEIAELLADAEHALAAGPEALHGRLALAAGLAFLGDAARALPIFEQAHAALAENLLVTVRLELTRAIALAYAQMPLGDALRGIARLAGQLSGITDIHTTNSHFCLSVLHFVESLVLGVASDDLALGEASRRFVEDDEHLIRRRIHRDLGGPRDH